MFVRIIMNHLSILEVIAGGVAPLVSALLAYLTWQVYKEQNNLIEDQTHATEEAQRASVQSLEVASKSRDRLCVIVKNSGGGAAKNLQGKVEFNPQDEIGLQSELYRSRAVRVSSSGLTDKNDSLEWVPSVGDELAAGESEVMIEVSCLGEISAKEGPLSFSEMMSIIKQAYIKDTLQRIRNELTSDQLNQLSDDGWNECFHELADCSNYESLADEFNTKELKRTQATIIREFEVNEDRLPVDDTFEFIVSLEYSDEFDEYETPILDHVLQIGETNELADVLSNDYSRQRRKSDPRGHELDRLS